MRFPSSSQTPTLADLLESRGRRNLRLTVSRPTSAPGQGFLPGRRQRASIRGVFLFLPWRPTGDGKNAASLKQKPRDPAVLLQDCESSSFPADHGRTVWGKDPYTAEQYDANKFETPTHDGLPPSIERKKLGTTTVQESNRQRLKRLMRLMASTEFSASLKAANNQMSPEYRRIE